MINIGISVLIIAFAAITGYLIKIAGTHKALKSISDSNYWLKKPWKWIFEAVMFICAAALAYVGLYVFPVPVYTLVGGAIGIGMVGIFSRIRESKFIMTMHMIGAFGGFILLGLSFALSFGMWWYTLFIAATAVLTFFLSRNKDIVIWNTEIILIYQVFLGLLYNLIILI